MMTRTTTKRQSKPPLNLRWLMLNRIQAKLSYTTIHQHLKVLVGVGKHMHQSAIRLRQIGLEGELGRIRIGDESDDHLLHV